MRSGDSPKPPNLKLSWLESLGSGIIQTQLCPMLEEQFELQILEDCGARPCVCMHMYVHTMRTCVYDKEDKRLKNKGLQSLIGRQE